MNNVSIIGTMTRDLELKYLPSGQCLGSFGIAVNQDYKKDGVKVEKVSFFNVTVFGKQAETVNQFFHKGSRIGITGELNQERWDAQDGTKREKTVISLKSFSFIDRKSDNQPSGQNTNNNQPSGQYNENNAPQQQAQAQRIPEIDIDEDEIPF